MVASLETKSKRKQVEESLRGQYPGASLVETMKILFGCDEDESQAHMRSGGFLAKMNGTAPPAAMRGRRGHVV